MTTASLSQDLKKPDLEDWENRLNAMECALPLEQSMNQSLSWPLIRMTPICVTRYLDKQVKAIKELVDHVTNRKMGAPESSVAEYLFDKHTLGYSDKES